MCRKDAAPWFWRDRRLRWPGQCRLDRPEPEESTCSPFLSGDKEGGELVIKI